MGTDLLDSLNEASAPEVPKRGALLYEGKAKKVFLTSDPELIVQEFKDSATAFDGRKRGTVVGKGEANARISAALFRMLERGGISTQFRGFLPPSSLLTRRLEMIPLEVVVRNVAAGSLAQRLGYEEGAPLKQAIVEFYYKDDSLGDPLVTADHVRELGLVSPEELEELRRLALKVNEALSGFFRDCGLALIDFKLEFGRSGGQLVLGDEMSPDTCRLWDLGSGERMDKDRFRRDLGSVEEAYQSVLARVEAKAGA